ncbi:hypothetical protein C5F47_06475 [Nitrosopumilus cobalaminigenes]|uniref:Uncharacterized protein n=1 Tax=Nitrosopumilus cobalaminigenes TaxID=1470066 RepID=A0A7D5QXU4_9ARCH|nr:hypothetical protein [Nitrosopumilus cobalaminigenes]QLH03216.1 hypothetical protein C5F47_06475 [Nitrosopumilus cobalaminigenes]
MKLVITIIMVVGISIASVFVISEIIWYFANQEFEKAREEIVNAIKYLINEGILWVDYSLIANTLKSMTYSESY